METSFWIERWAKQDIGFHQAGGHDLLPRYWPAVGARDGSCVFVPLAGKSVDMAWLAARGHRVIGSELSELAVDAFLSAHEREPAVSFAGPFHVNRAGKYEMWCGDFFALPDAATRHCQSFCDRAALIAMPRVMQGAYAGKLARLLPPDARGLLITLDYDPSQMNGPPFPVPDARVRELLSRAFAIDRLETRDVLATHPHFRTRGLTALSESAYVLTRRAA